MTETETLFSEILNCDRLSLYFNKDTVLGRDTGFFIAKALKRRIGGEPLEYILGKTEFMGLEFKVNPDILIPRPETEILVETVLRYAANREPLTDNLKILDIGTGSGCIAVSLAKFLPGTRITATDISPEALVVARKNALLNNVADRIKFIHSDLFLNYELRTNNYELIVSNPPYISTGEIDSLQPEVKCQPRIALEAGADGLDFYRRIIAQATEYLPPGGLLVMEMGFGQKEKIENIFRESGNFNIMKIIRDYSNIDRVIIARKG